MQGAIEKLQGELEKFKSNSLVQVLGQYILTQCQEKDEIAELVIKKDKTLEDLSKHIQDYARKKAVKGMAMLSDEDVFGEALKFYGVSKKETVKVPINITPVQKNSAEKQKTVKKAKDKTQAIKEKQVTLFEMGV